MPDDKEQPLLITIEKQEWEMIISFPQDEYCKECGGWRCQRHHETLEK